MAICGWCNQEMTKADDCTANRVVEYPDGKKLPASTLHFGEKDERCHDCGVKNGNYHHPGCDVERCPRCSRQLISCGCLDEEDD
jgi:hypothetical protein